MSTEQINPGHGVRLLLMLLASTLSGMSIAAAPVEESIPVGRRGAMVNTVVIDSPVIASGSVENPTAYLLNTIEQLRQEVMEMRGQLEEYSFRIDQLQQDSRDRYLDLDDRISRLSGLDKQPDFPTIVPSAVQSEQLAQRDEKIVYDNAFAHVRAKRFDEAKEALHKQLQNYPKGAYADNAYYWLGEVDMAQGRYDDAKVSFEIVLRDFPESPKVPDAGYKLGRVYDLLGNPRKSRELLLTVIQQHPQTAAARLSETYLGTMQ